MYEKVFIIAELSANHNNNFDIAAKTIEAMAHSGADAVKLQTYKPESLTLNMSTGHFASKTEGLWKGYTPWDLYKEASMPYEWQAKLKKIAEDLGLTLFSSPFDKEGVDFLESIEVPIYKIASFEITDIPLIEYAASKGKPMIMSTGVAEISDIEEAIAACRRQDNEQITLLKCTSQYPAKIEDANLLTIPDMKMRFRTKVGLSDHSPGSTVPAAAVALGAKVVEKHFILDRNMGGPDSSFSMDPHEFKEMVDTVRNIEKTLGKVSYAVSEKNKLRRRSLFAAEDIKAGDTFTAQNIRSIRPGHGFHPKYLPNIIGKTAAKDTPKGSPITENLILNFQVNS